MPGGPDVRPTSERVREAWMSILGPELEGATVLDLFAGSGALGLEALSRGARVATFVENSRKVAELLRANIEALDAGSAADLVIDDAFKFITSLQPRAFDIALADPPYSRGLAARLLQRFREVPFAQILSIEHGTDEPLDLSPPDQDRRYGDTAIAIVPAAHSDEENRR
ncbi:MAG: RsmD family RNA methyltransferase [Gemmatimonadota bacterium]